MKRRNKGWLQALLVVLVGAVAVVLSQLIASLAEKPTQQQKAKERVLRVTTQHVAPGAHRIRFTATGTVRVRSYVTLVPQVSGRVIAVNKAVYPGAHFAKGTELFRIDPKDYRLVLENQRALVAQASTALKIQRAEVAAAVKEWRLLNPDTPPPPLVAQKPQLEEARATLESAEATLAQAELDLARTRFSLPFAGRVVESSLEEGQFVTAGQSYGRVYSDEALEVQAPVTAEQKHWLLAAERPVITLSVIQTGGRTPYEGAFSRLAAEADPETRFQKAIFIFAEPAPSVLPGQFVEIAVIGPEMANVWLLPLSALQENNTFWVIDKDKRLKRLAPEILQITEKHVIAKSPGQAIQVVTQRLREATEGTRVEVYDAT